MVKIRSKTSKNSHTCSEHCENALGKSFLKRFEALLTDVTAGEFIINNLTNNFNLKKREKTKKKEEKVAKFKKENFVLKYFDIIP